MDDVGGGDGKGGEPLLYVPFLKPLLMRLKAERFRTYLETNGILWKALEEVIGWCDCIAMDMKPASVTKESSFDEEHRQFLSVARGKECFIKMVLSKEIDVSEKTTVYHCPTDSCFWISEMVVRLEEQSPT